MAHVPAKQLCQHDGYVPSWPALCQHSSAAAGVARLCLGEAALRRVEPLLERPAAAPPPLITCTACIHNYKLHSYKLSSCRPDQGRAGISGTPSCDDTLNSAARVQIYDPLSG